MPNNWKTYKLGELGDIKGGKRLPKGEALVTTKTKHPYIRVTDMGTRTIPIEKLQYVPNDVFPKISRYIVNKNDLILSIVGTVGSVSIIDEKLDNASLTENCVKITNLKNIDSEYLYYFLISDIGQFEIVKGIVGSTQPKLPIYNINNLDISLPSSIQEQKSIASILSAIDDKIENNLAINKTLEEMAMALYKHWFVDFGPFQDGEFVESELGRIPKGWEIGKLEDLLEIKYGKDHKKLEEGNIPVYGSGGIMRYVNESLYDKESILIPRKGTLSNLFYVSQPFWSVDTMFYSKIKDKCFGKYIFYFLKSVDLASMDVGSAVPSLTTELLKRIEIIIPPKNIVNEFDEIMNSKFNNIESNIRENQTLTQLRDTLLPKLISGEVRLKEFQES
ncbi:restriction endonuclease subunit S [Flavobacterium helocola]|uniref:Restriction endonuclease subunit S n=1 Tax=Flavobacterium helocola TaxID=3139139 RepID=A0ABU9I5H8_9FLAO